VAPSEGSQNIVKEKTFFFHERNVDLTKTLEDKDVKGLFFVYILILLIKS
jgi:hypothetical protein